MSVNKFYPINIQNSNNIVGTYGNVSLLVNANEETKGNTILNRVAVGKATSATYEVDVSGNINFSGNLYQNGVIYGGAGGSQSLSQVLSIGNKANTFIDMSLNDLSGCGNLFVYGNTILNRTAIGKTPSETYEMDVSGNINFSGNLYKNGTIYTTAPNQSLASVLSVGNKANTFIDMSLNDLSGCQNITAYGLVSTRDIDMNGYDLSGVGNITIGQNKTIEFDATLNLVSKQGGDIVSGGGYALSGFALDNVGGITMGTGENLNMSSGSIEGVQYIDFNTGDNRIRFQTADLTIQSLDGSEIVSEGDVVMSGFSHNNVGGINMAIDAELNMNGGYIQNADTINFANSGTLYTPDQMFITAPTAVRFDTDVVTFNYPAKYTYMKDLYSIESQYFNYRGIINVKTAYTIQGVLSTFSPTLPLNEIYNCLGQNPLTINLPDMNFLTGADSIIVYFARAFNNKVVTLNTFGSQQFRKMDNSLTSSFVFDNPVNNTIAFLVTKAQLTQARWIQITPLVDTDTAAIYKPNTFTQNNIFTAPVSIDNTLYTENLTFSNVSTDIAITNWDASIPSVANNSYFEYYAGTGSYTGTGFTTEGVSGTNGYSISIQRGSTTPYFNSGGIPVASNQMFVINAYQNSVVRFKTISYTLQAGSYQFGIYFESEDNGSGGLPLYISAVNNTTNNTIQESSTAINSAVSFPDWVFATIEFIIETSTDVRFEIHNDAVSYSNGMWVSFTGLELTYNGSIYITDTTTGLDATISAGLSILNNVSINNGGLKINSGGLEVTGGITTQTDLGTANTSLNTTFGSIALSTNEYNVAIGGEAMQLCTDAERSVALGVRCNTGATTIKDMVCIGYNVKSGVTERQSVLIGSNVCSVGSSVSNNVVIGYKTYPFYQGTARTNCIFIGLDAGGGERSNAYGALASDNSIAIGTTALRNCIDLNNVAIGHQALYELVGTNDIEEPDDKTQYNVALGYRAGYSPFLANKCTFIGAQADTTENYLSNSTAIGYNSSFSESNSIVLGGSDGGTYPRVLLPQKNYIYSCQNKSSNFSLAFGGEENVIITSSSVTAITLPTASTNNHIGTTFTFKKAYIGGLTAITITGGTSQNIIANNATANTYSFTSSQSFLKIVCIATSGNVWAVIGVEGGAGSTPSLSDVLAVGNTAGTYSINMNNNDISFCNLFTTAKSVFTDAFLPVNTNISLTGNVSYATNTTFLGKKLIILSNTSTTNTITIPNVAVGNQYELAISNFSNTACIISSNANISGKWGSGATTMTLYQGVTLTMYCNGTNWIVFGYTGTAQQVVFRNLTNQLVASTSITNPVYNGFQNLTWASRQLSQASGIFTNNIGYDLTLSVTTTYTWIRTPNSLSSAGSAANGIRSTWYLHSNTTNYPKFLGTNNINNTTSTGTQYASELWTETAYQTAVTQFILKQGENFRPQIFQTNTISNGGTGVYLYSTSQLDAISTTITILP